MSDEEDPPGVAFVVAHPDGVPIFFGGAAWLLEERCRLRGWLRAANWIYWSAERCRSGRTGRFRKPLDPIGSRGFESLPLRHFLGLLPTHPECA